MRHLPKRQRTSLELASDSRKVLLLLDRQSALGRGVLQGLLRECYRHRQWTIHTIPPWDSSLSRMVQGWKPDGIIGDFSLPTVRRVVSRYAGPMIHLHEQGLTTTWPTVTFDYTQAAALAARHLLNLGLRHFAYFAYNHHSPRIDQQWYSLQHTLKELEFPVQRFDWRSVPAEVPRGWLKQDRVIQQWLIDLPKPVGLVLFDDDCGLWLTQLCRLSGLSSPEQVAIVSIGGSLPECELTDPQLTSVDLPYTPLGQVAAQQLYRRMHAQRPSPNFTVLPVEHLTVRQSTQTFAIEDDKIIQTMRFIREQAHRPLRVSDLVAQVSMSRRSFERRFRAALGHSPLHAIRQAHLDRALELMKDSRLSIKQIAIDSGFGKVEQFHAVFKRAMKQTPAEYRRLHVLKS